MGQLWWVQGDHFGCYQTISRDFVQNTGIFKRKLQSRLTPQITF